MQGANKTINTKVGLHLPMSEQVRQRQVTLNEGKTLVNTKGVYGHRITMRPEGYLESEPSKFVSARISHYAAYRITHVGRHFPSQSITFSGRCTGWLLRLLAGKLHNFA